MIVISVTYTTCLAYTVSHLRTFDFSYTKARVRIQFIFEYSFFFIHMSNECKD